MFMHDDFRKRNLEFKKENFEYEHDEELKKENSLLVLEFELKMISTGLPGMIHCLFHVV